jgi:hypothetical protein
MLQTDNFLLFKIITPTDFPALSALIIEYGILFLFYQEEEGGSGRIYDFEFRGTYLSAVEL